jgi:hypothetical protein
VLHVKDRPLSPEIERGLRAMPRVSPPADLESRLFAAYDRAGRAPSAAVRRWPSLARRAIPVAAAAGVLAVLGLALVGGGPGRRGAESRETPLASWRVVDDPSLGFAAGRESADAALAGLFEGP